MVVWLVGWSIGLHRVALELGRPGISHSIGFPPLRVFEIPVFARQRKLVGHLQPRL